MGGWKRPSTTEQVYYTPPSGSLDTLQTHLDYIKTGRVYTVVVAASDASADQKRHADYTLTGTADETILSSAITAALGGSLRILGHTVNISATGLTIAGCTIDGGTCANDDASDGVMIRSAGTITMTSGRLHNLRLENTAGLDDKPLLLIQPTALAGFRGVGDLLRNVYIVDNLSKVAGSKGLFINLVSTAAVSKTVERSECWGVAVYGFDIGVDILADQTAGHSAWCNANIFQFKLYGQNTGLRLSGLASTSVTGNEFHIYAEGCVNYNVDITGLPTTCNMNTFLMYYVESGAVRTNGRFNRWFVPVACTPRTQTDSIGDNFIIANGNYERAFLTPLVLPASTELTIASGAITVGESSYYTVDTEADAATDNLDRINGGVEGQIIYLRPANAARDIVARDGQDNILNLGGNWTGSVAEDLLVLLKLGSSWVKVCST